eukprot:TRINITY_DN2197_c0_g1_i2.p1 TRINITY_DN2197_c0_g1~~TRINITY_DN2197_c0_g1_i2.p1  ORF type:complete len:956 (+),score=186.56 TRINITY_DN2197_c0_g1_i2:237-3104(+)
MYSRREGDEDIGATQRGVAAGIGGILSPIPHHSMSQEEADILTALRHDPLVSSSQDPAERGHMVRTFSSFAESRSTNYVGEGIGSGDEDDDENDGDLPEKNESMDEESPDPNFNYRSFVSESRERAERVARDVTRLHASTSVGNIQDSISINVPPTVNHPDVRSAGQSPCPTPPIVSGSIDIPGVPAPPSSLKDSTGISYKLGSVGSHGQEASPCLTELLYDSHDPHYQKVDISRTTPAVEEQDVCRLLVHALNMRKEFLYERNTPLPHRQPSASPPFKPFEMEDSAVQSQHVYTMVRGVMRVWASAEEMAASMRASSSPTESSGTAPAPASSPSASPEVNSSPNSDNGRTSCNDDGSSSNTETSDGQAAEPAWTSSQRPMNPPPMFDVFEVKDYYGALNKLYEIASYGPAKTYCYRQLRVLESRFNLHVILNEAKETDVQKTVPHRDFYNIRKVDTHVHHSSCMNQKALLRFIKQKLRNCPDEVVIFRDGRHLTLKQVFQSLELTSYDLSVDTLDVHADSKTFHRFDRFNLKYNPIGESRLREIFLKSNNLISGRYLAEITQSVIDDLEASKFQCAEYRISIYGRDRTEWQQLSGWAIDNKLYSDNVRWLIQIPRLYNIYRKSKVPGINSFQNILDNIFHPMFEATVNPHAHPKIHLFLQQVVGFDSVDDESKHERRMHRKFPLPSEWTLMDNPPYSYYIYYLYANLYVLNRLRESKGFNTFDLRPHCGEAGDHEHLACAFLTSKSIAHGINLRKTPVLEYLYYITQIGLHISPLSNNSLFLDYYRNPFYKFFARGLNVSLSTDDPLQFHYTKEPLIEEYSVAAQVYKLSPCDMCEIARNSCLQSGFEPSVKAHWLGDHFNEPGTDGNDIRRSNVPNIRIVYRQSVLQYALEAMYRAALAWNRSHEPSGNSPNILGADPPGHGSAPRARWNVAPVVDLSLLEIMIQRVAPSTRT